ncbi:thioredoxin domain-containing protein, partial [Sunxiuqinia dokdonensis]|uniref:thioredoxin domain-containing protein n=1 Tax=Sunxiuqinia dokdonensis TaxID=1409788 RepID=UPI000B075E50
MEVHQYTNELIYETSPYLLQHAHNPVNWMPWGDKALSQARRENKLLLISIGYAACHWCHVMEHESFEDPEVARVMNQHFVCIKVDREERPDVDQIYMSAVQLMTQRGGWPLNAIALPDGRPIWGGTYFQKEVWINALEQIQAYHHQNPERTLEYAERLSEGIRESNLVPISKNSQLVELDQLKEAVQRWKPNFDRQEGGSQGAPKFMMPNNLQFLLRWAHQANDLETQDHVENTLDKMAMGGIYDQLGGGFARYSTDTQWKVPHFEKMLYDNAQLLSVYAQAFQKTQKPLYHEVVEQTIEFLKRELLSPENGFYSSLDADSEGEEGKFYVWQKSELQDLLGDDFPLFSDYYQVNETGYWEEGNYILLRKQVDETFAKKHELSLEELKQKISKWHKILLPAREQRIRPGLDDKILTSWNALAISGLVDAYQAFGNAEYLELA